MSALLVAVLGAFLLFAKTPQATAVAEATPTSTSSPQPAAPSAAEENPTDRMVELARTEIRLAEEDLRLDRIGAARRRIQRLDATLRSEVGSRPARLLLFEFLGTLPPEPEAEARPGAEAGPREAPLRGRPAPSTKVVISPPAAEDPPSAGPRVASPESDPVDPAPAEDTSAAAPRAPLPKPAPSPRPSLPEEPHTAPGASSPHLDASYKKRKGRIKPDSGPKPYLALARWAKGKDLFEEQKEALQLATRIDPSHRGARTQLRKVLEKEALHRNYRTPWRREASVLFVETNTDEAKLHYYCDTVSAFYKRFKKIFRVRQDPVQAWGRKVGIRVFRTREDFARYARETGTGSVEGVAGYYRLDVKEIVLYYDPNAPEATLDTLFHEGTHLFSHLALGKGFYKLPYWVTEGIAEYFAPSLLDREKKDLRYGLPAYDRLRYARRILKAQRPSLRGDLLAVTNYSDFGAARYALAWSLIHMLLEKKNPGAKNQKYRARFLRYWTAITAGRDPIKSFESIIGPIDRIEDEWHDYIRSFEVPPIEEAIALVRKGDLEQAIPVLRKHLQEQPQDAQAQFLLGDVLLRLRRYSDARAPLEAAIGVNPEFVDALAGLTFAYAYLDEGQLAVQTGQRAVAISPNGLTQVALATAALAAGQKSVGLKAIDAALDWAGPSASLLSLKRELNALP